MSIIIEGMEMPTSCYFCPLTNDGFYLCKANNPYKHLEDDCEERKPNWCPIISVPEPHGDLIDRDALLKGEGRYLISLCKEGIDVEEILRAKTVIPAEEE